MNLKLIYSFITFFILVASMPNHAKQSAFENLTALALKAELFIKNNTLESPYPAIIHVKPISKKLKLKACQSEIAFEFSNERKKSGDTLIKASCQSPVKWRINLPVSITLFQDVLILKKPVIRGQSIDEDDVIVKKMNEKYLARGFYTQTEQLQLLEAKRNLKASTILSPTNLKPKQLIKSGQQVIITLNATGIGIKVSGTALHSASKGQLIKVRNNSSLKTVEGKVLSDTTVLVNL